jgi:hypothetical protein
VVWTVARMGRLAIDVVGTATGCAVPVTPDTEATGGWLAAV